MSNSKEKNVLKGQFILAQGNALGLRTGREIVRAIRIIKEKWSFRTNEVTTILRKIMLFNSVRNKFFVLNIMVPRTVFDLHPLPKALPWAEL